MARAFRPGTWIKNPNYRGDHWSKETPTNWIEFPTYRELVKNIKSLFEQNDHEPIHVYRTRRGAWGEWFEIWNYNHGKPEIVKQGWQ